MGCELRSGVIPLFNNAKGIFRIPPLLLGGKVYEPHLPSPHCLRQIALVFPLKTRASIPPISLFLSSSSLVSNYYLFCLILFIYLSPSPSYVATQICSFGFLRLLNIAINRTLLAVKIRSHNWINVKVKSCMIENIAKIK